MKKSLLGLLLAVALVVPAFATDLELIPKIGWIFSPELTVQVDGEKGSTSNESAFSGGADLFFDMSNNFFLGIGLMVGDNIKPSDKNDTETGFSNVYVTAKYKFLVNGSQDDPFYVYPLVNLGCGLPGWSHDGFVGEDYQLTTGFYWAVGVGGEYKNIILEFIYGCNYSKEEYNRIDIHGIDYGRVSYDFSYTAFRINVGYKFNL